MPHVVEGYRNKENIGNKLSQIDTKKDDSYHHCLISL